MSKISSRLDAIQPSATMMMTQRAGELKAMGVDIISFSVGEPDFPTPSHIIEAAKVALDAGCTRYTPAGGTPELKRAVAGQSMALRGVPSDESQVIISCGAKHVLYNFFMAVLDAGDEVVIPAPCWVSYPDQVRLAGGVPVYARTVKENNWVLTPESLEKVVTPRTRVVLLNSPSNPTGGLHNRQQMKDVVEKALSLGLYIVSDEIYRDLIYDGNEFVSALHGAGGQSDRVLVVDGVSKSYAMTGWRIGWGIGDPEIVAAMTKIQGQAITNPTAISQQAALVAITSPMDYLPSWKAQYEMRRNLLVEGLNSIAGVDCPTPLGAFYVFPDISALLPRLGAGSTDVDFAAWLLDHAGVAVVPGTPFGAPGHIRLSYATGKELIIEGLSRVIKACRTL